MSQSTCTNAHHLNDVTHIKLHCYNASGGETHYCWTQPYHAVHCKVVVLGLQLEHMLMVGSYLSVGCQEQAFIMDDPIEHLLRGKIEGINCEIYWNIVLCYTSIHFHKETTLYQRK